MAGSVHADGGARQAARDGRSVLDRVMWALWVLLLVAVPFTSHPWVARWNGGSLVSPLSGIPLLILAGIWLVPSLLRRPIPLLAWPLLAFALIAAIGALAVPFHGLSPWKDQEAVGRTVRAAVTLALGIGFYLTAATLPRGSSQIRASLVWLSLGAVLTLAWASVQATVIPHAQDPVPFRLQDFHRAWVIRDMFRNRVSGFAYEPSWLADQLVILYFPVWLGLILRKETAFPRRLGALTVEAILLAWGVGVLFLTFSRVGYVAAAALLGTLILSWAWTWSGRTAERFSRWRVGGVRAIRVVLLATIVGGLVLAGLGGLAAAARANPRIGRVFDLNLAEITRSERFSWPYALANRLESGERLVYWATSLRSFSQSPLLGLGLGVSGFYFSKSLPGLGYYLPEILDNLDPGSGAFPNPKSLWIRLLVETGALGFAAFVIWLVCLASRARRLQGDSRPWLGAIGTAGALYLVVLVFEGFSLDTFALPQLWLIPGLLTAASAAAFRPVLSAHLGRAGSGA